MKKREVTTTEITFTEDELETYTKAVWNLGFDSCFQEHQEQQRNPSHPITRSMTMHDKRFWEYFQPIEPPC